MATNYIVEKYNNLNIEEEFINNYLYRPLNIKFSEIIHFKKPKKFFVNKSIENFRTNKKGNLKTLREFQNLYIHKFIIHPKPEKDFKINFSLPIKKVKISNKIKTKFNKEKYCINNDIEKQRPFSQIESFKRANILLNSFRKKHSSYLIRKRNNQIINKIKNRNNDINYSDTINKIDSFNVYDNNKNNKIKNKRNFSSLSVRYEKSKLSLIKELSQKALESEYYNKNIKAEENNDIHYTLKKSNNSIYLNNSQNSKNLNNKINNFKYYETIDEYKDNFIKNNKIKNIKYIEIARNCCDFSDAYVIEKQVCPNIAKKTKLQKRPKIPLRLFSSEVRQMSTLEKYYLKFGVFPYY